MKKLLSLLCLSAALLLTPTKAQASGDCVFYWTPVMDFFRNGGVVIVQDFMGEIYRVDFGNVYTGASYVLTSGDAVRVVPGSCAGQFWGWTYFGACNTKGSITFEPPSAQYVNGVRWVTLKVKMTCDCPTGSSGASLRFLKAGYCSAPTPAPQ